MIVMRRLLSPLVGVGLALFVTGCGTASNNDQGVSFTNLGFFSTDDEGVCEDRGIGGLAIPLGSAAGDGGITNGFTCIGIQNNLSGQFIRTDRAMISYFVAGASVQPPSTVVALTTVLGPGSTGPDSTLPDGVKNPSQVIAGFNILPADIRTYISLNRADFPELPFTLIATVTVSGITSAGDRLDSNESSIGIELTTDTPIDAGSGAAVEEPLLEE
jgi:hypothetical protein